MNLMIAEIGRIEYGLALSLQEKLREYRQHNKIPDTLLLQEHDSVITLGKRGSYSNILMPVKELKKGKVDIYEVSRGGDVTYHGPGQLVGYLIFDLKNHGGGLKKFVWNIEEVFIRLLKENYEIESYRGDRSRTGVWVGGNKITAIGLAVSRCVTMHGFAFNINTNLDHFAWINPCGLTDSGVTSLERIIGQKQDFKQVTEMVIDEFKNVFGMEGKTATREELERLPGLS